MKQTLTFKYIILLLVSLQYNALTAQVSNDLCADAIELQVHDSYTPYFFSNFLAVDSEEGVLTSCSSFSEDKSDVWFYFVSDGSPQINVGISSAGNNYTAHINLYNGICGSLIEMPCEYPDRRNLRFINNTNAGDTVYIEFVSNSFPNQGTFSISVNTPAINNECHNPKFIELSSEIRYDTLTFLDAMESVLPSENQCLDYNANRYYDLWYSFKVPDDGIFFIEIQSIALYNVDVKMELFEKDCNSLTSLYCDSNRNSSFTNYPPGDTVLLRLSRNYQSDEIFQLGVRSAKKNTECKNAEILFPQNSCSLKEFSFEDVTPSGLNENRFYCGNYHISEYRDIWYKVPPTSSGNLQIEVSSDDRYAERIIIEAYNGQCQDLNIIACSAWNNLSANSSSYLELEELNLNDSIWIRLIGNQYSFESTYSLCVTDSLSRLNDHIYLIEEGRKGECDSLTNTYSQEFIVHWKSEEAEINIVANQYSVREQTILSSKSPDTITVPNIPSLGQGLFYDFVLRDFNLGYIDNASYYSGGLISALEPCYRSVNPYDECESAQLVIPSEICQIQNVSLFGSTISGMSNGYCTNRNNIDTWIKVPVPNGGAFNISTFWRDNQESLVEVYSGRSCSDLYLMDCFFYSGNSFLENIAHDTIWLKLSSLNDEYQGDMAICISEPIKNQSCINAQHLEFSQDCHPIISHIPANSYNQEQSIAFDCAMSNQSTKEVWYKAKLPSSKNFIINTKRVHNSSGVYIDLWDDCHNKIENQCHVVSNNDELNYTPIQLNTDSDSIFIRIGGQGSSESTLLEICLLEIAHNTDCIGAIPINVGDSCDSVLIDFKNASPSGFNDDKFICGIQPRIKSDLWYSFVAPPSGALIIETFNAGNENAGVRMEAYKGTCGSLEAIACNHDYNRDIDGSQAKIHIDNLTPGEHIYIRMAQHGYPSSKVYLCVYEGLIPSYEAIQLIELGESTDCDPITNTYDQDIIIHWQSENPSPFISIAYSNYPNVSDQIHYDYLSVSNPDTITFYGIAALNNPVSFDISIENSHMYRVTGLPYSKESCANTSPANDLCHNAINLPVKDILKLDTFTTLGATPSLSPLLESIFCYNSNSLDNDVWFSIIIPESREISIHTSFIEVAPEFEVYKNNCSSLEKILTGCYAYPAITLSESDYLRNINSGDTIFLRLSDSYGDKQGLFGIGITSPCPDDAKINYTLNSHQQFKRANSIEINKSISQGANIRFSASNSIYLHPGFEVEPGAVFQADLEGCNANSDISTICTDLLELTEVDLIDTVIVDSSLLGGECFIPSILVENNQWCKMVVPNLDNQKFISFSNINNYRLVEFYLEINGTLDKICGSSRIYHNRTIGYDLLEHYDGETVYLNITLPLNQTETIQFALMPKN